MPNVKYTDEQRRKVRELYSIDRLTLDIYSKGKYTLKEIGDKTGITCLKSVHRIGNSDS